MRYPITPEYLASAPDPIVRLYSDLEAKILEDICRRFKLSGEATESAIAQIKILRKQGVKMKKIEKIIKRTLDLSGKELQEIFERAVDRNREYYDHLLSKAELLSEVETGISKEILAIQKQTRDEFVNLTQSLGFAIKTGAKTEFLPIAKTYQKILDDASAQVLSGGMDYNTAIKAAVKRLTDSGLQTVDYASGWHNRVDVAARRAVMTGVSQLSAQYAEQTAEILETDLREVTAHMGARDTGTGWQNHKAWQGKVYSVSDTHPKYPSIYDVCGWGRVDGLEGANCRHHHFPFVEGVSTRTYTDEQLANIDPQPFEYQGRTYTAYEATQKQRQLETSMRKYKRDVIGYEAAGLTEDAQDAAIKLGRLSKEYKEFSKVAGMRTQPERAQVVVFGQKEAARVIKLTRQSAMLSSKATGMSAGNSSGAIEGNPPRVIGKMDFSDKDAIVQQLNKAEEKLLGLDYEVNVSVTSDGKVWWTDGAEREVHPERIQSSLKGSYSYHNHPEDVTLHSFSEDDVAFFVGYEQEYSKASDYLYEYVMKRTPDTVVKSYNEVYSRFKQIYKEHTRYLASDCGLDMDLDGYHETMKMLSKELRIDYERKKKNQ